MPTREDIAELNAQIEICSSFISTLKSGMSRSIVGQEQLVDALIMAMLSDGHILLEGLPGLAKTLAIKTLASLIGGKFSRVQFTPDLLPADVTGTLIYSQKSESFSVKKGPVFTNFLLADEINRAPAKVQSALLEAMQERQVTIGETTYSLPKPFLVMATQNPIEQEGTYSLPEAQTDRFMLKVLVDYPSLEEEQQILKNAMVPPESSVEPVVSIDEILSARNDISRIYVDERIVRYACDLVYASRFPSRYGLENIAQYIRYGGSPRASISLATAARTRAFMKHRGYVVPEDVREVAGNVLRHRIGLTYEAEADEVTSDAIIKELLAKVPVP